MNEQPKVLSIPTYRNEATDDKHLFRVVDRSEDWTHYYQDEIQKYLPAVNHIIGIGFPKGMGLINWIKKMSEEEADRAINSAAERGSKVHAAIRDLIAGIQVMYGVNTYKNEDGSFGPLSPDEWDYLLSWAAWAQTFAPNVLKHETAVWNKKYFYAGTVDFIGSINIPAGCEVYIDGKKQKFAALTTISCLLDWKTSGAVYDDYKIQTAAYAACLKISPKQPFYTGVVRIGTRHKNGGYEMHLWSRAKTLEHFKQFLQAKSTYHFINGNKDWTPEIIHVPTVLAVAVPRIGPVKKERNANNRTNPKRSAQEKRQLG